MLARTILRNVIEDDTPKNMLDTVVNTLQGETKEEIMYNYANNMYEALSNIYGIKNIPLDRKHLNHPVVVYGCKSVTLIDGWVDTFLKRYEICKIKLDKLARRLTDDPKLISILCGDCTPHKLRVCHGAAIREQYPRGAENMVKKRVQMFHDTAQEWCNIVDEFIETCDKKAPMLCKSEHVNFFYLPLPLPLLHSSLNTSETILSN